MEADARARPLATVGVLLMDDDGHVLIVEPLHDARWEVPGGPVDQGETPQQACSRQIREQLGLELPLGRLLVVEWAKQVAEERVVFVFDGGTLTDDLFDAVELPPQELESWACMPPEELFVMLAPEVTRRVDAALDARAAGQTWYLENGARVVPPAP
ncbi:MAG TPA: NUDIX hydrolase [Pseudonocardia sp.]